MFHRFLIERRILSCWSGRGRCRYALRGLYRQHDGRKRQGIQRNVLLEGMWEMYTIWTCIGRYTYHTLSCLTFHLYFMCRHVTWTNVKFSYKKEPQTESTTDTRRKRMADTGEMENLLIFTAFQDWIRKQAIATSPLLSPQSLTPWRKTSSR